MRVALIFDKTRADTTGVYFERACHTLGVPYDHWWLRDAHDIPPAYDLYWRIDHGDDYTIPLPDRLRPAVFYAIDTHLSYNWRKIQRLARGYAIVFCAQAKAARQLPNGEWLPLACDQELHGTVPGSPPTWDVAFVGTDGGLPRKFYLQILRERYPNSFIGPADYTKMAAIYSQARLGFNYSIGREVNMRIFEVMAANTLLMTNAPEGDDLQRLGFEERRHLVCYRTPQQLLELMDHFLARPDERGAIARAGAALVRARHTYVHRVKQLLAVAFSSTGPAHDRL